MTPSVSQVVYFCSNVRGQKVHSNGRSLKVPSAQIVNECRRGNFQHCDGQKFVGTTQEIIEKKRALEFPIY